MQTTVTERITVFQELQPLTATGKGIRHMSLVTLQDSQKTK